MKVGYVGLGKLGLPVALATEARGMKVRGHDPSPKVAKIIEDREFPHVEEGVQKLLSQSKITLHSIEDLVKWADLIFVAVQTPHGPEYGGETVLNSAPRDFDYRYLTIALREISEAAKDRDWVLPVAVISTCLPGTYEKYTSHAVSDRIEFAYNPYFIAMGTTIRDFYYPEFILIGRDGRSDVLDSFYEQVGIRAPLIGTDVVTAELTKMAYNTYIGAKIVFANAVMELAQKTGASADGVIEVLSHADKRLLSPAYLHGGMGDGGACHPRDNVALSYLASEVGLSFDLFGTITRAREVQTRWLLEEFLEAAGDLPLVVLGQAYKPQTRLQDGSPALLLVNMLEALGKAPKVWDPYTSSGPAPKAKAAYFIATAHPEFEKFKFPKGSVVLDPWRMIPVNDDYEVVRIGEGFGK